MEESKNPTIRTRKIKLKREHSTHSDTELNALIKMSGLLIASLEQPVLSLPSSQFKDFLRKCYVTKIFDDNFDFLTGNNPIYKSNLQKILENIQSNLASNDGPPSFIQALNSAKSVIISYQEKESLFSRSASEPTSPRTSSIAKDKEPLNYTLLSEQLIDNDKTQNPQDYFHNFIAVCNKYQLFDFALIIEINSITDKSATALQTANNRLITEGVESRLKDNILRNLAKNLYKLEHFTLPKNEKKLQPLTSDSVKKQLKAPLDNVDSFIKAHSAPLRAAAIKQSTLPDIKLIKENLSNLLYAFLTSCRTAGLLGEVPKELSESTISACLQNIQISFLANPEYYNPANSGQFEAFLAKAQQITKLYRDLTFYHYHIENVRNYSDFLLELYQDNAAILAAINNLKEENFSVSTAALLPLKLTQCLQKCKEKKLLTSEFDETPDSITKELIESLNNELTLVEGAEKNENDSVIITVCAQVKEILKNYLFFLSLNVLPDTTWKSIAVKICEYSDSLADNLKTKERTVPGESKFFKNPSVEFSSFCKKVLIPHCITTGIIKDSFSQNRDIATLLNDIQQKLVATKDARYTLLISHLNKINEIMGQNNIGVNLGDDKKPSSFSGIHTSLRSQSSIQLNTPSGAESVIKEAFSSGELELLSRKKISEIIVTFQHEISKGNFTDAMAIFQYLQTKQTESQTEAYQQRLSNSRGLTKLKLTEDCFALEDWRGKAGMSLDAFLRRSPKNQTAQLLEAKLKQLPEQKTRLISTFNRKYSLSNPTFASPVHPSPPPLTPTPVDTDGEVPQKTNITLTRPNG